MHLLLYSCTEGARSEFDSKGVSGAKKISVAVEAAGYRGVKLCNQIEDLKRAACGGALESMIDSKTVSCIFAPSAYFACSAY